MSTKNPLGAIFDIVESFPVVDLTTAANTGDWVDLKNATGILCVFGSGLGTAAQDPVITFEQGDSNTGGNNKAISPSQSSPANVWKKQAATSLAAVTAWTDANADMTANVYDEDSTQAEEDAIVAIYFDAEAFDVDNGFHFIQASVADVGANAQVGFCIWILMVAYPNDPANVLSPLG